MSAEAAVTVSLVSDFGTTYVYDSCGAGTGLWWTEMTLPEWAMRNEFAEPSSWIPGSVLLASVRDSGDLALSLAVRGGSLLDTRNRQTALANALQSWPGLVTIIGATEEGELANLYGPWRTFPAVPQWGPPIPQAAGMFLAQGVVSITVNPEGSP